ncbi:MAG: cyclic nucleotide-binding domain-containing protein [Deferrisomatales bacterium]|nr:cyclic nucleotide-binding domain-containing protein [Deferrisomatales bacterium]
MAERPRDVIADLKRERTLFRLFEDSELEVISPYFEPEEHPKGTTLFREGDPGDFVAVIRSGTVEVRKQTEFEGKWVVLAQFGRGSILGELTMFDNRPRSATVLVSEDVELLVLRRDAMEAFLQEHPALGVKLLKGVCRILSLRLRQSAKRLTLIF